MGKASNVRYLSNGTKTELRPDADVVLSLKDSVYKTVMEGYFRRLGTKKTNDKDKGGLDFEKAVAKEAFLLFKDRKKGGQVRFFKPESRYSFGNTFVEVDEDTALKKITSDIYRRMESSKRWMKSDKEEDDDSKARKSPTLPQAPPEPSGGVSTRPRRAATAKPPPPEPAAKKTTKRGAEPSGVVMVVGKDDPANHAASVIGSMKTKHHPPRKFGKPNVVIYLGEHIIDTGAAPALVQSSRKRSTDSLPDYFNPTVRPSVPTNDQQIFIPGNKVYARWMDQDDPGSYGTWYPGLVHASKIAPIQDDSAFTGVPNLLYDIKFDDGEESLGLDRDDIIIHDQYQTWLEDLERYYSLPVNEEVSQKPLAKNTRVYAKWIDPTDPELHGTWISGTVLGSKTWEGADHQWRHSYHVCFDSGDEDEDLRDVLEVGAYKRLMSEKMESRKRPRLSGFEALKEASKISSPVKMGADRKGDALIAGLSKKKLYTEDSDGDGILREVEQRGNEVQESKAPGPSQNGRPSNTPSSKYQLLRPKSTHAPPQDQSQSSTLAKSNGILSNTSSKGTDSRIVSKGHPARNVSQGSSSNETAHRPPASSDVRPKEPENENGASEDKELKMLQDLKESLKKSENDSSVPSKKAKSSMHLIYSNRGSKGNAAAESGAGASASASAPKPTAATGRPHAATASATVAPKPSVSVESAAASTASIMLGIPPTKSNDRGSQAKSVPPAASMVPRKPTAPAAASSSSAKPGKDIFFCYPVGTPLSPSKTKKANGAKDKSPQQYIV